MLEKSSKHLKKYKGLWKLIRVCKYTTMTLFLNLERGVGKGKGLQLKKIFFSSIQKDNSAYAVCKSMVIIMQIIQGMWVLGNLPVWSTMLQSLCTKVTEGNIWQENVSGCHSFLKRVTEKRKFHLWPI